LGVFGPVYRGGSRPATVAARRAAIIGWVGITVVPSVVLGRVLQSHPGTAVTLRYSKGSSHAVFSGGAVPKRAQSLTIDLHNGWTVTNVAPASASGVLANGGALALLGAGIALSLLLGLLVSVLGTGRARAMRLVEEKTRELRAAQEVLVELDQERQRLLARTVEAPSP
jgi:hypothetical protein